MQKISSKLDWTRMLGFEQIAEDRSTIQDRDCKIAAKVGGKMGVKRGQKVGVKIGEKVGIKR